MDKGNSWKTGEKNKDVTEARQKSITSAVLGVASYHGMKLSTNMTSQDKKELLSKLEEWRKARREKMVSNILAKQRYVENAKGFQGPSSRIRPSVSGSSLEDGCMKKNYEKETVFDRLYKNSTKAKKDGNCSQTLQSKVTNVVPLSLKKVEEHGNEKSQMESKISSQANNEWTETKMEDQKKETTVNISEKQEWGNMNVSENETILSEPIEGKCIEVSKNAIEYKVESRQKEILNKVDELDELTEEKKFYLPGSVERCIKTEKTTEKESDCEVVSQTSVKTFSVGEEDKLNFKTMAKPRPTFLKNGGKKLMENSRISSVKGGVKENDNAKPKYPLRRSISMIYRKKCGTVESAIHRAVSEKNLHEIKSSEYKMDREGIRTSLSRPKCKTPEKITPRIAPKSTKLLTSTHLRNKLEDWLKVNGHSLEGYRHLRCFGIPKLPNSSLKASTESDEEDRSYSYAASKSLLDDSDKENVTPSPAPNQQAPLSDVENWLKELHRLIVELKYPPERCEEWLTAIRKKCTSCTQLHIYWECMAALDESKSEKKVDPAANNETLARVNSVDSVEDSLAQLFDKMVIEQEKPPKPKLEKGLDPKNIFKSTIIKFAVQQKPLKESDQNSEQKVQGQLYVATPVRRSSRIRTPCKAHVVTSLQSLTPEVRRNTTFKPNESLFSGE